MQGNNDRGGQMNKPSGGDPQRRRYRSRSREWALQQTIKKSSKSVERLSDVGDDGDMCAMLAVMIEVKCPFGQAHLRRNLARMGTQKGYHIAIKR